MEQQVHTGSCCCKRQLLLLVFVFFFSFLTEGCVHPVIFHLPVPNGLGHIFRQLHLAAKEDTKAVSPIKV